MTGVGEDTEYFFSDVFAGDSTLLTLRGVIDCVAQIAKEESA